MWVGKGPWRRCVGTLLRVDKWKAWSRPQDLGLDLDIADVLTDSQWPRRACHGDRGVQDSERGRRREGGKEMTGSNRMKGQ